MVVENIYEAKTFVFKLYTYIGIVYKLISFLNVKIRLGKLDVCGNLVQKTY